MAPRAERGKLWRVTSFNRAENPRVMKGGNSDSRPQGFDVESTLPMERGFSSPRGQGERMLLATSRGLLLPALGDI
jgi:hypothetical protein